MNKNNEEMEDKQIKEINEEIKKAIQRIENVWKKYDELREKYKAKEQECEEWQVKLAYKVSELQNIEEKIKPLMKRPDDLNCYDLEWIVCAFADEFKQLKAENERLQEERKKAKNYNLEYGQLLIKATNKNNKLKQILTEIKEIAEDTKDKFYDAIHTGGLYDRLEQIIRKINEVDNG